MAREQCSIETCSAIARSRGWCKPHYDAWYKKGDPLKYVGDLSHLSLWERIQHVGFTRNQSTGCLEYNGSRNDSGYGQFRYKNRLERVHRVAHVNLIGELSQSEVVMHKCDNPACSEPTHLRKGTQAENITDMHAKGRHHHAKWTHCPNGHEYPLDRPSGVARNRCRICALDRNRRYYQRKREQL